MPLRFRYHGVRPRMFDGTLRLIRVCRCHSLSRRCTGYVIVVLLSAVVALTMSLITVSGFTRNILTHQDLTRIEARMDFLESLYLVRHEEIIDLQESTQMTVNVSKFIGLIRVNEKNAILKPEIIAKLRNMTGMRAALGMRTHSPPIMRISFVLKIMPHLMEDASALRPAYHMQSYRKYSDIVIGIPTVKRDKESYLMVTLKYLIDGMNEKDMENTLIVVFVGETDLMYVLETAQKIELTFPQQVRDGMIEVMSPSPAYYPDLDNLPQTLGDSQKRVKWRSKQNLDTIYLMAYAQSKGTYYLMLEDDVISSSNYMQEIKEFTASVSVATPNWYIIEFCRIGGIGKLFKSAKLIDFIIYVQLFYGNMPIDWLIESFLADRVCTIDKASDPQFNMLPTFYPHSNPPLKYIRTSLKEHPGHTLKDAYEGKSYFWGSKPKKGDTIEFWFEKPTNVVSYTFRSGNVKHPSDKLYDTIVEAFLVKTQNYTFLDTFDEFGLADGIVKKNFGPFKSIRFRFTKDNFYWTLLSEIEIKTDTKLKLPNDIANRPVKKIRQQDVPRRKSYRKARSIRSRQPSL